jgi:drug/metabolite transporter (DMT)-like permease
VLLAVPLGLLAGFLFAASAVLQQRAAQRTANAARNSSLPRRRSVPAALLALIRRLLRNPMWLAGWLTNLLGFFVQALALHVGSVALVQPLLVSQLLFALLLASGWNRRWPTLLDWSGAGAITGGLVVFLAVRGVVPSSGEADRRRALLALVLAAVLIYLLVTLGRGRPPLVQATLMAIAAGLCFALTAVLIKLTLDDLVNRGVVATSVDWPGYTLALVTFIGLLLEQGAFAVGSLPAAVAAMTITNPIAGYLAGVLAFHVMPPGSPGELAALAGSGALLVAGTIALANSGNIHPEVADIAPVTRANPAGSASS